MPPASSGADRRQRRDRGRRRAIRGIRVDGRRRGRQGAHRHASTAPGDFSTYTLRLVSLPTDRRSRPTASIRGSRRSSSRSRSPARATSTASRTPSARRGARPSRRIDYLAKDYASFRRLMLDRLSGSCPTGGSATPPTSQVDAGRAAGLRRRPPELPPGRGRHRGLPRHGARAAPRSAATRGCSTTDARRLQRPRLGAFPGEGQRRPARRHAAPHRRARAAEAQVDPAGLERLLGRRSAPWHRAAGLRDPARGRRCARRTTASTSTPGATATAACPRRTRATLRGQAGLARSNAATCCSSRRSASPADRHAGRRRPGAPLGRPADPRRGQDRPARPWTTSSRSSGTPPTPSPSRSA